MALKPPPIKEHKGWPKSFQPPALPFREAALAGSLEEEANVKRRQLQDQGKASD